ncbi:uncharacterized protein LOC129741453 [Uranotaenia lowii]|uniref:uncharacterized protein LOC129741453 n=1 Tax=Uranotaenia lowii TaxID=190385 RepID=UPI00247B0BBF|nr:uncharacterized protein LOC129741453 [Uranotaenia lowii]
MSSAAATNTTNATNATKSNCILCDQPDTDQMVGCDLCENWAHYQCAEVSESIADPDRTWKCPNCRPMEVVTRPQSVVSETRTRSSRKSQRVEHELNMLKEQHELMMKALEEEGLAQKKKAEEEEAARKKQTKIEDQLRKKRYEMEEAFIRNKYVALSKADEAGSVSSNRSSREKVSQWLASGATGGTKQKAPTAWEFPPQPLFSESQPFATTILSVEERDEPHLVSNANDSHSTVIPTSSSTPHSSLACPPSDPVGSQIIAHPTENFMHTNAVPTIITTAQSLGVELPPAIRWSSNEISPKTMLRMINTDRQNQFIYDRPATTTISRSTPRPLPPRLAALKAGANIMTSAYGGCIPSTTTINTQAGTGAIPKAYEYVYSTTRCAPATDVAEQRITFQVPLVTSTNSLPQNELNFENQYGLARQTIVNSSDQFLNNLAPSDGYTNAVVRSQESLPSIIPDISSLAAPLNQMTLNPRNPEPHPVNYLVDRNPSYGNTIHDDAALPPSVPIPTPSAIRNPLQPSLDQFVAPSPAQLAARQVINRDLPHFAGDPEEWPLFFSTFQNSTKFCGFNDAENLSRLQRSLRGQALEAVKSRLMIPESVPQVLDILKRHFGRPEILLHSLMNKLRKTASPKEDNLQSIIAFELEVRSCVDHMIMANLSEYLFNPMLLQELVNKLPPQMQMHWSRYKRQFPSINLEVFSQFTTEEGNTAADVVVLVAGKRPSKQTLYTHTETENVPNTNQLQKDGARKTCNFCGNASHQIANCESFLKLDSDGRWRVVKANKLCRICLVPHKKWPCRSPKECGVDDCRNLHHSLLHSTAYTPVNASVAHHYSDSSFSLYRYLPIILKANGKSAEIIAFLDDGSSSTMLEARVATELGISGEREPLWLSWTGNVTREEKLSQRISVTACGVGKTDSFKLNNVRTVDNLFLPKQTLDYASMKTKYPHLRGLPVNGYSHATPSMIIGIEHTTLLTSLKVREGHPNDPVATKTRLGWCIFGKQLAGTQSIEMVHVHSETTSCDHELHKLVGQLLKFEECNTVGHVPEDDKRALAILEKATRRVEGRFETGLLFKYPDQRFPNSFPMANRRLLSLESRLAKNPFLDRKVREQIKEYLQKGYAHKATAKELRETDPEKTWYLPLGVVQNPKKPEKVRLIWDAAARVNGISLNDTLLKGPDLLTSLTTILVRFRQRNIAITGDIKEMFHQIRIRESDKHYQRFLFRDNPQEPPQVYIMDVATFGASCSPCVAQFVKNRNATEHAAEFPGAAKAIVEDHYVDDFLKSVDTTKEAVELTKQVQFVHARGGFEIRNFASNSSEVLNRLGESNELLQKDLNFEPGLSTEEKPERVLGMVWKPQTDVFTFNTTMQTELMHHLMSRTPPTKRQVLKIIMSVFDPLGLIAHYTVHGRILMQEIWKYGSDWDEQIPSELQASWFRWSDKLKELEEIIIPRCMFKNTTSESLKTLQLHTFVDASEAAYSCVVYARIVDRGIPKCAIVAAKTKVAPLKPLSIPRLELQAAVEGSRLTQKLVEALTLPVNQRFLWSDSTTVLSWLRSDSRRYHQYVSCRIGEILRVTSINEWRYVPSKLNVADEATKWNAEPNFNPQSRWFVGPDFLLKPEGEWPSKFHVTTMPEEEIRTVLLHLHAESHQSIFDEVDYSRFSQFNRLLRAIVYFHRAIERFRKVKREGPFEAEEIAAAENFLWRQVQMESYPEEYATVLYNHKNSTSKHVAIKCTSPLYQLAPFMDENNVLRMRSRIEAAPVTPYETKYPVLLPKEHRATHLLVHQYHRRYLHGNQETVVNEMRQRFQIPHLRALVKRIAKECQMCKVNKAVPKTPMMSPLPAVRLTPFIKPFTHTGIDYFGPLMVKQGRSLVKRWVALFTCLTIRAVHLEIVSTLSTQSCVLAIRRFVARRGSPTTFYTDNGTNFLGASNLLINQIRNAHEECALIFTNAHTRWYFNPPATPHMGGPWERMVRSVKQAMTAIADHPQHPSDEVLETVALEAEAIVNSRPLTYVPLDSAESEALTPNHFLLYGSTGIRQPATALMITNRTLRDSWNLARTLVDKFWVRWVKEYLPMLTRRSKWFAPTEPLKPGDLVMVVNEHKRNDWIRGQIVDVVKAPDGQVRRAVVRTANGEGIKSVSNLALLDVQKTTEDSSGSPGTARAGEC